MTIKEALAAKLQTPISDLALEVILTDRDLDGSATYTAADKEAVELALMDALYTILTQPDIVEGGYSISHPGFLEKVKERLRQLATTNGATDVLDLIDPKPTVNSRSVW